MTEKKKRIPINDSKGPPREEPNSSGREQREQGGSAADRGSRTAAEDRNDEERYEHGHAHGSLGRSAYGAEKGGETPAGEEELGSLEVLERERDEYLDALRRTKAEYENYRKRAQRDLADAELRAKGQVIGEFLPILDNLDRALDAAEHHEEGKVIEGIRLTHDLFVDLLRKEGVQEIDPVGEVFDPRLHEAMVSQPSDEEEGTVTAVFERGYALNDRVLRPARVAVSQGRSDTDGNDDA